MEFIFLTGKQLGERMYEVDKEIHEKNFKEKLEDYDGDVERAKRRAKYGTIIDLFSAVIEKEIRNIAGKKIISKKTWGELWSVYYPALELISDFDPYEGIKPDTVLEMTEKIIDGIGMDVSVSGRYIKLTNMGVQLMEQPDDIGGEFTHDMGEQLVDQIVDAGVKFKHQSITRKEYEMICNRIWRYIEPVAQYLSKEVQDRWDHNLMEALRVLHFLDLTYTEDDVECGRSAGNLYYLLRFGHRE